MNMQVIINQMIQLFLVIGLGYLLRKLGLFDQGLNKKLSTLLLQVTMPAMVLSAVLKADNSVGLSQLSTIFIVSIAAYLLLPLLGLLLNFILRVPKPQKGLYLFMTTFGNVGFMGFPVMNAIFGSQAMLYTAIFNMFFNLFLFTMGAAMMQMGSGEKFQLNLKKLISPGVLSALAALLIYLLKIPCPLILADTVELIGSVTTPLAMLVIGSTLASMPLKEVFNDIRVHFYSILKQLAFPLLLYPLLRWLIADELLLGVSLILLAMPVANAAVLFSTEYGRDQKLAAKSVFLTTLLSAVVIPLLVYLFLI
ncbi:MAG: AEC family transporter [Firmicutes bacterium]|nr:AEC family transporter [Bacillota bacterium]